MATPSSRDDDILGPSTPDAEDSAWGLDPYDDAGLDASGDAELGEFFEKAHGTNSHGGRYEQVSALSALSAQMDSYRPLPPEEQARRIAAYNTGLLAAAELEAGGRMSRRRRAELEQQAAAMEAAQTELVGSMFRLVLVIARELAGRRYGRERSLDMLPDLVAAANLALVEAVGTFDPSRGPAFSVYAGRVVRQQVRSSLSHTRLINVPVSWLRLRRLATTLLPELTSALGRPPLVSEIQDALRKQSMEWAAKRLTPEQLKLPEAQRQRLMHAKLRKQGTFGAIDNYEEVMMATQPFSNLDAPLTSDGSATLGDMLTGDGGGETFDAVELDALRTSLFTALAELPERDREIVLYRFGFADGEQWTYARLAPRYGISAERVRQIERAALDRLRGPGFEMLDGFLPGT